MKTNKKVIVLIIAVAVLAVLLAVLVAKCSGNNEGTPANTTLTETTELNATEPDATEPDATEPEATVPSTTVPATTEPAKKPGNTQKPKPTEPKPTEPKPTEPKPTEPAEDVQMVSTAEDLITALNAGKNVKMAANISVDGSKYNDRYVVAPQGSDITLNLNGKTLTVTNLTDDLIETSGDFALKNGTVKISGPAGEYGAFLCNKGTGTVTIKNTVLVSDIDTAVYVVSNMNYGKMIVEDTEIKAKTGCLAAQAGNVNVTNCKFTSEQGHEYFGVTHALFLKANGTLKLSGNITVNIANPVGAEVAAIYNYVRVDQKRGILTGNYTLTTNCPTEVCVK